MANEVMFGLGPNSKSSRNA